MCTEGALDMKDIFESFQGIIKSASAFPFSSIHPSGDGREDPRATVVFKTISQDIKAFPFSHLSHNYF